MWVYIKHLERPVKVHKPDLKFAKFVFAQFGGPDGEFAASWRYFSQRYAIPTGYVKAILTDIGTEELAHLEIVATMIYQLLGDATPEELEKAGLGDHYTQHGRNLFLHDAAGVPWVAAYYQSFEDPVTCLHEDMAAEQKARATYENLLDLATDEGVKDVLGFLREREVVHFQRFGEALDRIQEHYDHKHIFTP